MKPKNKVKVLLFFVLAIMAIVPLIGSFVFFNEALQTSLNLGFNKNVSDALAIGSESLVKLKKMDPSHQLQYRKDFDRIEKLRMVYSQPESVRRGLNESFKILFIVGLGVSLVIAFVIALMLSAAISRSYRLMDEELEVHREKIRYLAGIQAWQHLAQMLAHEIKNPLTPVELSLSSLKSAHQKLNSADFAIQLSKTVEIVFEEIGQLKELVCRFSNFAKMEKVNTVPLNFADFLERELKYWSETLQSHRFEFFPSRECQNQNLAIDRVLFRQLLKNIFQNAIEANSQRTSLQFSIQLLLSGSQIELHLQNDGTLIKEVDVPRIWDPYFSTKLKKENMGLGLAIVKKIAIEHGGSIRYQITDGKADFVFSMETQRNL